MFLAFAKAKYPATSTIPDGKVKLSVDVAYNMRRRVKEPFPELTVGLQNDVATLPGLDKKGVDFSSRFWDVARTLKLLTDNSMQSPASMAQLIYCHHKLNPASTALKMTAKKGVLGDVTISNLGRWPFPSVYELVEGLDPIRVKALHLFCAEPYFGSCATLYVTGTDQLNYSMAYTMTDDVSSQVFGYMVKAIEAISTISSDESMQQVCERLLGQETFDQESVMA